VDSAGLDVFRQHQEISMSYPMAAEPLLPPQLEVTFWHLKVPLQRERRSQVEPRCAERWHLSDDEQFDLAAWFPSLT